MRGWLGACALVCAGVANAQGPAGEAAGPASDWQLLVSTSHARAAVFVRDERRVAIALGELLPDTPWRLAHVGDDRVVLTTAEPQTAVQLDVNLQPGERVPPAPTPATVGAGSVVVPVIDVVDAPERAP